MKTRIKNDNDFLEKGMKSKNINEKHLSIRSQIVSIVGKASGKY